MGLVLRRSNVWLFLHHRIPTWQHLAGVKQPAPLTRRTMSPPLLWPCNVHRFTDPLTYSHHLPGPASTEGIHTVTLVLGSVPRSREYPGAPYLLTQDFVLMPASHFPHSEPRLPYSAYLCPFQICFSESPQAFGFLTPLAFSVQLLVL